MNEGRLGDAESMLRPIADQEPPNVKACVLMIELLLKTERSGDIAPYHQRAARAEAKSADESFAKAMVLSTFYEDWEGALACLESGLREKPTVAKAWEQKAEALIQLLDVDGAIAAYRDGIALAPENSGLKAGLEGAEAYKRAKALSDAKQQSEAAAAYAAAAVPLRSNSRVLFDYGRALLLAKRAGEALPILNRAFQLSPGGRVNDHLIKAGCLIELRLIEEAQALVRELLPKIKDADSLKYANYVLSGPAYGLTRLQLAMHWHAKAIEALRENQFLVAHDYMHRALYIHPGEIVFVATMAQTMVLAGASTDARKMMDDGLALFREVVQQTADPATRFNYVQALRITGHDSEALEHAEALARETPTDLHLAQVITELRQKASAPSQAVH